MFFHGSKYEKVFFLMKSVCARITRIYCTVYMPRYHKPLFWWLYTKNETEKGGFYFLYSISYRFTDWKLCVKKVLQMSYGKRRINPRKSCNFIWNVKFFFKIRTLGSVDKFDWGSVKGEYSGLMKKTLAMDNNDFVFLKSFSGCNVVGAWHMGVWLSMSFILFIEYLC